MGLKMVWLAKWVVKLNCCYKRNRWSQQSMPSQTTTLFSASILFFKINGNIHSNEQNLLCQYKTDTDPLLIHTNKVDAINTYYNTQNNCTGRSGNICYHWLCLYHKVLAYITLLNSYCRQTPFPCSPFSRKQR